MSSDPDETTQLDIRQKAEDRVQGSSGNRAGSHDPTIGNYHDATSRNGPAKSSTSPPDKVGRYELREEIGSGTFGEVFLCYDPQLKREVAIKLRRYQPSGSSGPTSDMLHEAQSVARLRHPGIVAVLDMGTTDDGRGFIVYEYVEGQNLRERIEAGDITRRDAVRWVAETAEALHYAHTRGLVHRDVKPANILIDTVGHTRLADFGSGENRRFVLHRRCRPRAGDRRLHEPRAGRWQVALGHVAIGHLFAGRGAVRAAMRPKSVQFRQFDGPAGASEASPASAAAQRARRYSQAAGDDLSERDGQGAGRSLYDRRRHGG